MSKTKFNTIINILEIIFFIPTVVSSLVFFFVWPSGNSGYQGGRNLNYVTEFWGLEKQQWSVFHTFVGLIFIILMTSHILLHWRWFTCLPKLLLPKKTSAKKCNTK